jgi:hypothetical protein
MKTKRSSTVTTALSLLGCFSLLGCSVVPVSHTVIAEAKSKTVVKAVVAPAGSGTQSILSCESNRIEYTPIPALPAGGYTRIKIENNKANSVLEAWPSTPTEVNKLLTNISTNITQSSKDASGGIGGIFSASHSQKQYVIDFMKWRAEPLITTDDAAMGWVRVGAGLRLIVNITKDDGSASGSLFALAVSAKAGKVEGSISTELIGMDAKEATQAMPFTVDLSEGNIQKVVEALAVVKTKLYDDTTTVFPNLVARIQCAPVEEKRSKE